MQIRKVMGEKRLSVQILNIAIVLVCVAIVVTALSDIVGLIWHDDNRVKKDRFVWALEDENYYQLETMARADTERSRDKSEYYALGEYFHEAVMYQAFLTAGDEERAEAALQRMQEAEQEIDNLEVIKVKIQERVSRTGKE